MRFWSKPNIVAALSAAAATATAVFTLPGDIDEGQFILDLTTVTGTSPTLDVQIQTSPDNGTTYYNVWRFPQKTAASIERLIVSMRADATNTGTTGTNANSGNSATITLATTGALSTGCPIVPDKMRVRFLIGGTNPAFTGNLHFIGRCTGDRLHP